jgi:serine/threonine protein kinase
MILGEAHMQLANVEASHERSGLAKHRILVELGQGGMSNVYLAVARGPGDFHKLVVLKVLRADLAQEEAFRTMALSEAKIAARLNHPNVVQTYEVLNEGERPVIVMEYLEGQSLSNVLSRTKADAFSLAMRLRVLADALGGLHHAHELCDYDGSSFELVHRDFTPQNIFVGYDGHVKVLDFGIAKTTAVADDDSRTGTLKGKVRYMSPEQIIGAPPPDRRADIYAAGMILWELIARAPPYKGDAEIAIINKVINAEIPSLRSEAPDAPEELVQICEKATQFDRDARFATAAEMQAAIELALETMNTRGASRDIGRVVSEVFADTRAATKRIIEEQLAKTQPNDETPAPRPLPLLLLGDGALAAREPANRRRSGMLWIAAAAGAMGLAVIGFATLGGGRRKASEDARPPSAASAPATSSAAPAPVAFPTAPTPAAVEIRIRAVPPSAAVYFDDQKLESNPTTVSRRADGTLHSVRADAKGYLPRTVQIVVDKGADLVLTLDRAPSSGSRAGPRPATDESQRAKPPDCSPPYYIDARGIKMFKPGCI